MKEIKFPCVYKEEHCVSKNDLAIHVGSGDVAVLATPVMIAWMEHAAAQALHDFLEDGETSVGVMMHTSHDAATPSGMQVFIEACVTAVDRKKITFEIIAKDACDVIGKAVHERFLVSKAKFEQRAATKGQYDSH